MNDRWSDDAREINNVVNELLQNFENSEDGDMIYKYLTTRHLSKIHAAITGTLK